MHNTQPVAGVGESEGQRTRDYSMLKFVAGPKWHLMANTPHAPAHFLQKVCAKDARGRNAATVLQT